MKKRFKTACLFLLFAAPFLLKSQPIGGVINSYSKITAIDTCSGKLTVSTTNGFQAGQAVILMQMKGATISADNNSSFGNTSNAASAGLFEVNEVASVSGATTLFLKFKTVHKFDFLNGAVQLVSFPKYAAATVFDTLRAQKWDGSTGGVLAIQAQKLTMNAPLDVRGAGFRGGISFANPGNNCNWAIAQNDFFYDNSNWRGAQKGEGIAATIVGKEAGKGPQATGGGGGNDHNSGGGGGGIFNFSGGKGGTNDEPQTFGCNGEHPGLGGKGLVFNDFRLFLGGGGGAGHANNGVGGSGGLGGGIIICLADTVGGSQPILRAGGLPGGTGFGDGAGGGGAGGSIFFQYQLAQNKPSVEANGGRGGLMDAIGQDRCQGPGGGGAGGLIRANHAVDLSPNGLLGAGQASGGAGFIQGSAAGCNLATNGAGDGSTGQLALFSAAMPGSSTAIGVPQILAQPESILACEGDAATFEIEFAGANSSFVWQVNDGSGWVNISLANPLFFGADSPILTVKSAEIGQEGWQFRCRISPQSCFQPLVSEAASLSVLASPTVDFQWTVQNFTTVIFENISQNTTGQFWDFGDGQISPDPNPTHFYDTTGTFAVLLAAWNACDTFFISYSVEVDSRPMANFTLADTVFACGNSATIDFENTTTGNVQSFQWLFPGGQPGSSTETKPVVTYSASGSYVVSLIASNGAGSDTLTQNFHLVFENFPVSNFTTTQNMNSVFCTNLSTGAGTYAWNFNDNTPIVQEENPSHTYPWGGFWVITLVVQNSCGAAVFQESVTLDWSGVADSGAAWGLKILPNPTADGLVQLDFSEPPGADFSLQVFDLQGKKLLTKSLFDQSTSIDLTAFSGDVFLFVINSDSGLAVRKIVKF